MTPLRAIRLKCLDCCCGQAWEVRDCSCPDCGLYPYRLGKNPARARLKNNGSFAKNTAQRTIQPVKATPRVSISPAREQPLYSLGKRVA